MTLVHIRVKQPSPAGKVPAQGTMYWVPTRLRIEDHTIILPKPFQVTIADGVAEVDVDPTGVDWVWAVEEKFFGSRQTIHVAVPSIGPVEYTDLTRVDPETLDPINATPEAQWYAYVNTLSQDVSAARMAAEESKTVVVDETGNAQTYAQTAVTAATTATTAATTATTKAGQATSAQAAAAQSSTQAQEARDIAVSAEAQASSSAQSAQASAQTATSAAGTAVTAKSAAETARDLALQYSEDAGQFHSTTIQFGVVDNTGHLVLTDNSGQTQDAGYVVGPPIELGNVETTTGPAAPGTIGPQGFKGDKGDPGGIVMTDLGNVDLNGIVTPGAYKQTTGANATLANNYPVALVGSLIVLDRGATRAVQIYYPIDGVGTFRWSAIRTQTSSGWGPWSFQTTSRVDQTAGRVIYSWDTTNNRDQLIYGDTGSRVVNDLVDTSKFTVNVAKIRRVGSQVELRISLTPLSGISGNHQIMAGLPVGFRNQHTYNVVGVDGTNLPMTATIAFAGGAINVWNIPANRLVTYTFAFQTYDPWPTTLPGTADGVVINN